MTFATLSWLHRSACRLGVLAFVIRILGCDVHRDDNVTLSVSRTVYNRCSRTEDDSDC